ncbi:EF-hand domain-containing protein [Salinactinospora qingdaonensis]|uniref:EF-hand domain-containing protein n=1 Tax=Salinactinospora qingdaonensis TaxID=702744 RepID=A0ABP7GDF4_9ACTN
MVMGVKERQRLDERFALWDVNGDGQIDKSDWEAEARRILQNLEQDESSAKAQKLIDAYLGMWDHFSTKAGKEALNVEEFAQIAEQDIIAGGESGFDQVLRPTIGAIADLLDIDGDGQVSPAEFDRWIEAIGVQEPTPQEIFAQIDTDDSGLLSVDEMVAAVRDYHMGRNDIPFLGR